MTKEQELFFKELQDIQDFVVNVSLIKISKYDDIDMKKLLNDVTYETNCMIMELLDGYRNNDLRGEIINRHTGKSINSNIELHDHCEEYLNCADIL